MKIYTRNGDDGRTHLGYGPRVAKDDPHVEACGAVDELNAMLGLARAESLAPDIDELLHRVQHELFRVGADLAMPGLAAGAVSMLGDQHVEQMEREIDLYDTQLPPLTEFILPGGSRAAALLHCARTVCRRAERRVVSLDLAQAPPGTVPPGTVPPGTVPPGTVPPGTVPLGTMAPIIRYLNRLSDLLFMLPRVVNARGSIGEEGWRKESRVDP
ncbi:MAG: cob(I)yrinic acid a,c-diamide adenosyltransferase [Pirellulaceae bacterium]